MHKTYAKFDMGINYLDRGDYDMAIVYFDQAINTKPNFGEAYNNRGIAYRARGEDDQALADFERAIQLLPNSAAPYNNKGAVYLSMGEYVQAFSDFDKALEIDQTCGKAYYNRGLANLETGIYNDAIVDFDSAIQTTSEELFQRTRRKEINEKSGMFAVAPNLISTQTFVDLPTAYAFRGIGYFEMGDVDRALADLDKALELGLDPNYGQVLEALFSMDGNWPEISPWESELYQ